MTHIEALKLALEALEASHFLIHGSETKGGLAFCMDGYYSGCFDIDLNDKQTNEAITAIKEALAQPEQEQKCWCTTCRPITMSDMRFVVCPDCGNKRCPRATNHKLQCTNSNEPNQAGSVYTTPPQRPEERNFCPRCGKRTNDIHTCTPPPQENT